MPWIIISILLTFYSNTFSVPNNRGMAIASFSIILGEGFLQVQVANDFSRLSLTGKQTLLFLAWDC